MSITTYDELKTAVARWMKRDDLTAYIPDYISLAEGRIFHGDSGQFPTAPLRVRANQIGEEATASQQQIRHTYTYLQTAGLSATSGGSSWSLRFLPLHQFLEVKDKTGTPTYYTIIENTLWVAPAGSATYFNTYWLKPTPLSSANQTNVIFTPYPELYLYAACVEGCVDVGNDAMAARFAARLAGRINALNVSNNNVAAGGSLAVTVGR